MENYFNTDTPSLGVCYYPEQWDSSLYESDLERMKALGIKAVRIGEFAWSVTEPREGEFDFSFFDEFLSLCEKKDMKVIFGTPTCTPPAWLSEKYPETLNAAQDGTLYRHGLRQHHNYTSEKYLFFCRRITEKLAEHFAAHPSIIGWQIDNEVNCEIDRYYSESDHKAFREYLKREFETVENLNEKCGTVFWNQTYQSFDEIYLPRPVTTKGWNPHIKLLEKRFISETVRKYCKMQADILKKYIKPGDFITTNGVFGTLDTHEMNRESLDFISFDNYPNFAYDFEQFDESPDSLRDRKTSRALTLCRSISDNFAVMEQQSGPGGWVSRMLAPSPLPSQMRLWTMQAIAHGADYVSYFRWRTAAFGTEIYWHGILNYDNLDNRRVSELSKINEDINRLSGLRASKYKASVAVLKDYSNIWDSEEDIWQSHCEKSEKALFEAAGLLHTPLDLLYLPENREAQLSELSRYKVIFSLNSAIVTPERAKLLQKYVENGGTLIVGTRSGYKDIMGKCPMAPVPGLLRSLCGISVSDFSMERPEAAAPVIDIFGGEINAVSFFESLSPEGAEIIGTYKSGYMKGSPAVSKATHGRGTAYYFGCGLDRAGAKAILKALSIDEEFSALVSAPEEIETALRENESGEKFLFLLNFGENAQKCVLQKPCTDVFGEKAVAEKTEVEIPPYGAEVFKF